MKPVHLFQMYLMNLVKMKMTKKKSLKRMQVKNCFILDIIPSNLEGRPVTRGAPKLQATMQKISGQKKRAEHQM